MTPFLKLPYESAKRVYRGCRFHRRPTKAEIEQARSLQNGILCQMAGLQAASFQQNGFQNFPPYARREWRDGFECFFPLP